MILEWILGKLRSRDSSVGIVLSYGLDDRGSRVRFPAGAGNYSLHRRVQNGSGAHPAFYPMVTRGSFPVDKAAGADHSPPSSAEVKEWVELYLHSSNTPSWRGAQSTGITWPLPFYHNNPFMPLKLTKLNKSIQLDRIWCPSVIRNLYEIDRAVCSVLLADRWIDMCVWSVCF
jgi:hypothetical protein